MTQADVDELASMMKNLRLSTVVHGKLASQTVLARQILWAQPEISKFERGQQVFPTRERLKKMLTELAATPEQSKRAHTLLDRIETDIQDRQDHRPKRRYHTTGAPTPPYALFGRQVERLQLEHLVHHAATNGRGPARVLLLGARGVGKSRLAIDYFEKRKRLAGGDRITKWIDASTRESSLDGYRRLAAERHLAVGNSHELNVEIAEQVKEHLLEVDDWTLIFDGVEDPIDTFDLLPQAGRGVVLITSSSEAWRLHVPDVLDVSPMLSDQSRKVLLGITGLAEEQLAKMAIDDALAIHLVGLGLEIKRRPYIADDPIRLQGMWQRATSLDVATNFGLPDHPMSAVELYRGSFEGLSPSARELMALLAVCAPHPADLELVFASGRWQHAAPNLQSAVQTALDLYEVINELLASGLAFHVDRDVACHGIIGQLYLSWMGPDRAHSAVFATCRLLAELVPDVVLDWEMWSDQRTAPLVLAAVDRAQQFVGFDEPEQIELLVVLVRRVAGALRSIGYLRADRLPTASILPLLPRLHKGLERGRALLEHGRSLANVPRDHGWGPVFAAYEEALLALPTTDEAAVRYWRARTLNALACTTHNVFRSDKAELRRAKERFDESIALLNSLGRARSWEMTEALSNRSAVATDLDLRRESIDDIKLATELEAELFGEEQPRYTVRLHNYAYALYRGAALLGPTTQRANRLAKALELIRRSLRLTRRVLVMQFQATQAYEHGAGRRRSGPALARSYVYSHELMGHRFNMLGLVHEALGHQRRALRCFKAAERVWRQGGLSDDHSYMLGAAERIRGIRENG